MLVLALFLFVLYFLGVRSLVAGKRGHMLPWTTKYKKGNNILARIEPARKRFFNNLSLILT